MVEINPDDTQYEPPVKDEEKGEVQKTYEDQDKVNAKQKMQYILMLAACHLNFSVEHTEPYATYQNESKKKKGNGMNSLRPTKKLAALKIKRRNPKFKSSINNTTIAKLLEELSAPPLALDDVIDKIDVDFIKYEERRLRKLVSDRLGGLVDANGIPKKKKAEGHTSHDRMRLVLCLENDEEIVKEYKLLQYSMTRAQLDARNSQIVAEQMPDFFKLVCAKFNDSTWMPSSKPHPTMHPDFDIPKVFEKRKGMFLLPCKQQNFSIKPFSLFSFFRIWRIGYVEMQEHPYVG
jgi:hypothetical protein